MPPMSTLNMIPGLSKLTCDFVSAAKLTLGLSAASPTASWLCSASCFNTKPLTPPFVARWPAQLHDSFFSCRLVGSLPSQSLSAAVGRVPTLPQALTLGGESHPTSVCLTRTTHLE